MLSYSPSHEQNNFWSVLLQIYRIIIDFAQIYWRNLKSHVTLNTQKLISVGINILLSRDFTVYKRPTLSNYAQMSIFGSVYASALLQREISTGVFYINVNLLMGKARFIYRALLLLMFIFSDRFMMVLLF